MLGWPFADQSDTEQRRGAIPAAGKRGVIKKEYKIEDLTKEEAAYIGAAINAIVPHEVDADEEEFILKVENENGEIVGGCIAEAYEYRWSRMFLDTLWVDERYRHHGIGSMIIHERIHNPQKADNKLGNKLGNKKPLNQRRSRILAEMRNDPNITTAQLRVILNCAETTVENNIAYLRHNGYIERVGSRKNGYWKLL